MKKKSSSVSFPSRYNSPWSLVSLEHSWTQTYSWKLHSLVSKNAQVVETLKILFIPETDLDVTVVKVASTVHVVEWKCGTQLCAHPVGCVSDWFV